MIILYIPFTPEESVTDLSVKAEAWKKKYDAKTQNSIVILHYKTIDASKEQYEKIKQAIQHGQVKIYVLAHGVDTKEYMVSNVSNPEDKLNKIISIDEVAEKFKEDFLTGIRFNKKNNINLYFCDTYILDNKAKKMAKKFEECLKYGSKDLKINYYSGANVMGPSYTRTDYSLVLLKGENRAGLKGAEKRIAMTFMNDLFHLEINLLGNPSAFKHALHRDKYSDQAIVSPGFFDGIDLDKINPMYKDIIKGLIKEIDKQWMFNPIMRGRKAKIINEIIQTVVELLDKMFKKLNSLIGEADVPENAELLKVLTQKSPKNIDQPVTFSIDNERVGHIVILTTTSKLGEFFENYSKENKNKIQKSKI